MPLTCYVDKTFTDAHADIILEARGILADYAAQGYDLTLRQLYYQFVARDLIPNTQRSYKRLGSIVSDARLAGSIDWNHIVDRTRNLRSNPHWSSPASIIRACATSFRFDLWEDQPVRPEVWIEKEALIGIVERAVEGLDVAFFACKGYNSQSEMWRSAQRINARWPDQETLILHLGDHDPSGIDMTRDIEDRLDVFACKGWDLQRLALNADQVEQYDPPPNPAKLSDSRSGTYVEKYGFNSWELDALEPSVISDLIRSAAIDCRDNDLWEAAVEKQNAARDVIRGASDNWETIAQISQKSHGWIDVESAVDDWGWNDA